MGTTTELLVVRVFSGLATKNITNNFNQSINQSINSINQSILSFLIFKWSSCNYTTTFKLIHNLFIIKKNIWIELYKQNVGFNRGDERLKWDLAES